MSREDRRATQEDEARRAAGAREAGDSVEDHLGLAVALAHRHGRHRAGGEGATREDLIAEAFLGLVEAWSSYWERREAGELEDVSFGPYAGWVIRRRLWREKRRRAERRGREVLWAVSGGGDEMEVVLYQVRREARRGETSDPAELVVAETEGEAVRGAVGSLSERERAVVWAVWFEDQRRADVARDLGVSRNRVGFVADRGMRKMRRILVADGWRPGDADPGVEE